MTTFEITRVSGAIALVEATDSVIARLLDQGLITMTGKQSFYSTSESGDVFVRMVQEGYYPRMIYLGEKDVPVI